MIAAAAPGAAADALGQVLPWLGVLALLAIIGGVAIWLLRRAMRRDSSAEGGFTLQELRDMRASGALSEDEFNRARDAVIGRLAAPGGPGPGDGSGAAGKHTR